MIGKHKPSTTFMLENLSDSEHFKWQLGEALASRTRTVKTAFTMRFMLDIFTALKSGIQIPQDLLNEAGIGKSQAITDPINPVSAHELGQTQARIKIRCDAWKKATQEFMMASANTAPNADPINFRRIQARSLFDAFANANIDPGYLANSLVFNIKDVAKANEDMGRALYMFTQKLADDLETPPGSAPTP